MYLLKVYSCFIHNILDSQTILTSYDIQKERVTNMLSNFIPDSKSITMFIIKRN